MSDGRKYDVGDKVTFTDDEDRQVAGVIHGVRYQEDSKGLRDNFEYIVVHEADHKTWWDIESRNQAKLKVHHEKVKSHQQKIKDLSDNEKVKVEPPIHPELETHPELKQHIRIFED